MEIYVARLNRGKGQNLPVLLRVQQVQQVQQAQQVQQLKPQLKQILKQILKKMKKAAIDFYQQKIRRIRRLGQRRLFIFNHLEL
jgi:D-ribose pyranose/furanose isomerase RbsD